MFQDLVFYLVAYQDVDASQTAALVAKLQENGAAVGKRFSERVTHVVVQRTHAPTAADKEEGDARLRDVFQRIDHVSSAQQRAVGGSSTTAAVTEVEHAVVVIRTHTLAYAA